MANSLDDNSCITLRNHQRLIQGSQKRMNFSEKHERNGRDFLIRGLLARSTQF